MTLERRPVIDEMAGPGAALAAGATRGRAPAGCGASFRLEPVMLSLRGSSDPTQTDD